jgi:hypothetical protein
MKPVTDPALLQQLNAPAQPQGGRLRPITDPALLQQLNAPEQPQGGASLSDPMAGEFEEAARIRGLYPEDLDAYPDLRAMMQGQSSFDTSGASAIRPMRQAIESGATLQQAQAAYPAPEQPAPMAQPAQNEFSLSNLAGSALSGFNQRVAGIPGDIVDASSYIARQTVAPVIDAVAGTNYADQIAASPSMGQGMRDAAARVVPRVEPTSQLARYGQAAGQGMADAMITGAAGGLMQGAKGVTGAVGRFLAPNTGRELGVMAASGAGGGAGAAAGGDVGQSIGGETGRAVGQVVGGIGGGIGAGVGANRVANSLTAAVKPRAPSLDALRAQTNRAYEQADAAGVVFTPEALQRVEQEAQKFLTSRAFTPEAHKDVMAAIQIFRGQAAQGNITLKGFEELRRAVRDVSFGQNVRPNEKAMIRAIDTAMRKVIDTPRPEDVLMGNAKAGSEALARARSLGRRVAKADELERRVQAAQNQANVSGAGGNVQNRMRAAAAKIVDPMYPYRQDGWTPQELAALQQIVDGTATQNTLRVLGNAAPTGGMSFMLNAGAAMGSGGMSLPLSAALTAAHAAGERMTVSQWQNLMRNIRSGATSQPQQQTGRIVAPIATGLLPQATPMPQTPRRMVAPSGLAAYGQSGDPRNPR